MYEIGTKSVPRDNVLIEYGMFIQKNTRKRTFFIVPKNFNHIGSQVKIATDLAGICCEFYDTEESKRNEISALGKACNNIRRRIQEIEKDGIYE